MGKDNIRNVLMGHIQNPYGVAGLMGNLDAESGLKSNRLENLCKIRLREAGRGDYTDEKYTAEIDSGRMSKKEFLNPLPGKQYGYGLAQWTTPKRKEKLYILAKSRGKSIGDESMQLEFLISELKQDYPGVWRTLCNAGSVREASDAVLKRFEMPTDTGESMCKLREAYGMNFLENGDESNMNQNAGKTLLRHDYSQFTPAGKNYFVRAGAYGNIPHRGDVVYFYSNSLKRVAHVGIVATVQKQRDLYIIYVVEGNTSAGLSFNRNGGVVALKQYTFTTSEVGHGNRIDGFGTPNFGNNTCDVDTFVAAAMAEVGYTEKESNNQLYDKLGNPGTNNFTKYGEWYGNNGVYWCQQFVSWVAHESCKRYSASHPSDVEKQYKTWVKRGEDWYYYDAGGEKAAGRWEYIDDRYYVFDESGKAIKGWFKSGEEWYYLGEDYAMISGQWLKDKEDYYYFDKTGQMMKNVFVKMKSGTYCFVDADGKYDQNKEQSSEAYRRFQEIVEGE